MRRLLFGIAWLAGALALSGCFSVPKVEAPHAQADALALLSKNQFTELDRRYTDIQKEYKAGLISDEDLRAAFRVFYATDPALGPKYALWVQEMPDSYVAHLARGIYYKRLGQERRGDKYIDDTSNAQIQGMEDAFRLATQELSASMTLDDKPLLSYLYAIDISSFLGQPQESRRLFELSVKIDPNNYVVREKYMTTLQTRWGGSVEEMRLFLEDCRNAHQLAAHLQRLEALVEDEVACNLCKTADALFDAGKFEDAIPLYSQVLEGNPDSISTLDRRGMSELQVGQSREAVTDFTHAADLGDAYAMDILGKMYMLGNSVPQDRVKAIEWLNKAAALGYQPSKELLPFALNPNMTARLKPGSLGL